MSLISKSSEYWLFVDIYGCVISVSAENYPTHKLAVMRAFNKSRGG
jgi:hypothetical protein